MPKRVRHDKDDTFCVSRIDKRNMDSVNIYKYKYPESNSKRVKFFGIGGFISIFFLILIFLLNYFNILPLSILFPSQLAWLPHKQEFTKTTSQPKKTLNQPAIIKTPTISPRFSYDKTKAEKTLENYIRDNIKEDFLPPKIDIKQNLISSGELTGTDYKFGANWTSNDIVFHAGLHYINDTNELRDTEFFIIPPNAQDAPIDSTNSATLVKTYLKNIPETIDFDCGAFNTTTRFCEDFRIKETGKSGFGTGKSIDESGKNITLIFSCFIPQNNSYYTRRTSCLLFREKEPNGL